jgi:acetyl-CoA synthase
MALPEIILQGARGSVAEAEALLAATGLAEDAATRFPDTAYHLPIAFALTGKAIGTVAELREIVAAARGMLPVSDTPTFDDLLAAGAAAALAAEAACALRSAGSGWPTPWLGPAGDLLLRQRGVEFVDGTAPGFAVVIGPAESEEAAVALATALQERSLYTFFVGNARGESAALQLHAAGIQLGWETRLVPFGPNLSDAALAVGFAVRAAMSFGNLKGGDAAAILSYCTERVRAFIMALGEVSAEEAALAVGAMNFGIVTVTDQPLPEVTPPSWDHPALVGSLSVERMVEEGAKLRGIRIKIDKVPIPVPYGMAFEGERIRKPETYLEISEARVGLPAFEWVTTGDGPVKDGEITITGPDVPEIAEGTPTTLGIVVRVAGEAMERDFEPLIERQIHHFVNGASGLLHIGQRDALWIRISKEAVAKGLRLAHIGTILHARIHQEYGGIVDAVSVEIVTDPARVAALRGEAHASWEERDQRLSGLTDEAVETFYSCTLCQSFAPDHVCVITPERPGLCGAYSWLDGRANHRIAPTGPNQPIEKEAVVDATLGQWRGVNTFVAATSHGKVAAISAYSLLTDPMTSCGCFEAITAILPLCNGVMIVDRDFDGMTPSGMKFSTLAGFVGGGVQSPGFMGHSRLAVASRKYILAEGGIRRVVWMSSTLKRAIGPMLGPLLAAAGVPDLLDQIADETTAQTEEEVAAYIAEKGHPALSLPSLI